MRLKVSSIAAIVLIGALFVAGKVNASGSTPPPPLVTQPEIAPTSCVTKSGITIAGVLGANSAFPVLVDPSICGDTATPATSRCFQYQYNVTTPSSPIYYSQFSVSATQFVALTSPASTLIQPAYGDDDQFLNGALHEYVLKFGGSTSNSLNLSLYVQTALGQTSNARVGTVNVRGGGKYEGCLLATPGVTSGNTFQPVFLSQTALVAGGKCPVNLTFDASGNVVDVNPVSGSNCLKYEGPVTVTFGNNVGPLRNNSGPNGITFGDGTTTCYGPPVPSLPKCICTKAPCP